MATFKVYCGQPKPLTAVGEHQVHLLKFAAVFPHNWHTIANNRTTLRAIRGLERRGSLIVDWGKEQFKIAYGSKS